MKKNLKTLVAISLIAVHLVGCGNVDVNKKTDSHPVSESSTKENAEVTAEVTENKYPEYLNLDGYRPIVSEGENVTLTMLMNPSSAMTTKPDERWFYQFIEQVLNIDVEMDQNYSNERKGIILNSGDLPDMMWDCNMKSSELVIYGQEGGLFLDISEYISEELTPNIVAAMEKYPEAFQACVTPDGKMYTVPQITESKLPGGTQRIFVDTAYMKAAGIEELPTTLDGFLDMLRAFKDIDPETMGVDEVIPWIINWHYDWYYLMSAFGWVTDDYGALAKPTWDEQEQQIVIPCLQDKFKDYIKVIYTMYKEDLIHDDYFTMSEVPVRALSAEGKCAVVSDYSMTASQPDRVNEFVALSPVASEWCDKPISGQSGLGYKKGLVVISAETEYPEVCVRFLDYLYSPEGSAYAASGPVAGHEDELGLIEGIVAKDGDVYNKAVADGKYPSNWDYQQPYVQLARAMELNCPEGLEFKRFQVGLGESMGPDEYHKEPGEEGYEDYQIFSSQYPYLVKPMNDPYASAKQTERLTDLRTVMESYVDAEMAKFVVGARPIEELDKFMEELWALDGQELLDLGREIYKR